MAVGEATQNAALLLRFVEFRFDQLLDGSNGFLLVRTIGLDRDDGAAAGGKKENAEDRLAVDFLVAFPNLDVGCEPRRGVHQLVRLARMESVFFSTPEIA